MKSGRRKAWVPRDNIVTLIFFMLNLLFPLSFVIRKKIAQQLIICILYLSV